MRILRALFPSWKFFDSFEGAFMLYGRVELMDGSFGPWIQCLQPPKRKGTAIFLNPRGNIYHLSNSTLERLIQESSDAPADEVPELVSFRIIQRLALAELRLRTNSFRKFQFKILMNRRDEFSEDLILSPFYEV